MNRRAKFDADSFILAGEISNRTNTHTEKKTVNYMSTPCLSACVDKNHGRNCGEPMRKVYEERLRLDQWLGWGEWSLLT